METASALNARPSPDYSINGKVAVIAGAAGGIGSATALRLAQEGAFVVLGYNRGSERVAQILKALPGENHTSLLLPLEDSAHIAIAAKSVSETYGRCDILVNAAGVTYSIQHEDLAALTDGILDELFRVNVRGAYALIREFSPLLKASGDGVIVNVSSVSAFTGRGSNIGYCGAKAAMDAMMVPLARVLGPEVRIVGIAPAGVDSDFVPGRDREALIRRAEASPLKILVTPEHMSSSIIGAIKYLRLATGTSIIVDGGAHFA